MEGEAYALPPLPYAYDALEPAIDEETLRVHHDKHHAGYVRGLNSTLEKLEAARKAGDYSSIKALSRDLAFHGSGHMLHTLYWKSMTPKGSRRPSGRFRRHIEHDFGSFTALGEQFRAATKAVEASGWGVLAIEPRSSRMVVLQAEKHQDLTIWGVVPLMVCDVWEHAYYLHYQNRRADYVEEFFKIVDWDATEERYRSAVEPK